MHAAAGSVVACGPAIMNARSLAAAAMLRNGMGAKSHN